MGKDKSGGFHPPKGKPSGSNGAEEIDIDPSVQVLHPNRNVSKGSASFKAKENSERSDNAIDMAIDGDVDTGAEELSGILTKEDFMELANFRGDCCATIYLPTHQSGVEVNEKHDVILFKNALQDLTKQLESKGIEPGAVSAMLTPGFELLKDDQFWARMGKGLAVFISEGYFKYIKMGVQPTFEITCQKRFYMTPLIPLMACKEYFYLLIISKHKCKLFKADAFGMEYVPIEGMPEDVLDVKKLGEKDASTVRIGTSSGTGGANFHGMAGGNPDDKTNTAVYFEAVDDLIYKEVLNKENVPLVLAGVEYLIPIYKSVCDYKHIWPEGITGSHEHDETNALYAQVRELMNPYFKQPQEDATTIYANQSATELTSSIPEDVIPGAYYGRISHLFVEKGAHIWGTFDENTSELSLTSEEQEGTEDLLDMALIKTLATGGAVFTLNREEMPAESTIAAVFRY